MVESDSPTGAAERMLEQVYDQAASYAVELRQLYRERRAQQAELEQKVAELEQAQALLREYARDIAETYHRLEQTYLETLDSLALAVEHRDGITGGHSHRVAHYAGLLGRQLGLPEPDRRNLYYGSLLHDIGKIGIPDSILHKPGRLTEAEWAVMRQHPEIGARLVERVEFLRPAVNIILTHHERYDGQGYPRGLRGECIPLGSRIFQIADTLDAIVSDRPYRLGQSLEAALDEIQRHSGSQFDPLVVEALQSIAPGLDLLPAGYGVREPVP